MKSTIKQSVFTLTTILSIALLTLTALEEIIEVSQKTERLLILALGCIAVTATSIAISALRLLRAYRTSLRALPERQKILLLLKASERRQYKDSYDLLPDGRLVPIAKDAKADPVLYQAVKTSLEDIGYDTSAIC